MSDPPKILIDDIHVGKTFGRLVLLEMIHQHDPATGETHDFRPRQDPKQRAIGIHHRQRELCPAQRVLELVQGLVRSEFGKAVHLHQAGSGNRHRQLRGKRHQRP